MDNKAYWLGVFDTMYLPGHDTLRFTGGRTAPGYRRIQLRPPRAIKTHDALPPLLAQRIAVLNMLVGADEPEVTTSHMHVYHLPGVGRAYIHTPRSEFFGHNDYVLELTPAEYDQLVAALGEAHA